MASVDSAEVPDISLLFPCEGLGVLGMVNGGVILVDGGVEVVFLSGILAIGLPH